MQARPQTACQLESTAARHTVHAVSAESGGHSRYTAHPPSGGRVDVSCSSSACGTFECRPARGARLVRLQPRNGAKIRFSSDDTTRPTRPTHTITDDPAAVAARAHTRHTTSAVTSQTTSDSLLLHSSTVLASHCSFFSLSLSLSSSLPSLRFSLSSLTRCPASPLGQNTDLTRASNHSTSCPLRVASCHLSISHLLS